MTQNLPKQDYALTLSSSIFISSWQWTSLPEENCHWKPLVLAIHRDLNFIRTHQTSPHASTGHIDAVETIPSQQFFIPDPMHPSTTLQNTQVLKYQNDPGISLMKPPWRKYYQLRHSRHTCFIFSHWLLSGREVLGAIIYGQVQENHPERTSLRKMA